MFLRVIIVVVLLAAGVLSMVVSPLVILVLGVTNLPVGDPLFAGVLVSVLFCGIGLIVF